MAEYTLHCFAQSGNAYKPALMLAAVGRRLGAALRGLLQGATKTPEYRAQNVMGEVPLLSIAAGATRSRV
jgi:glutathione S-transferase